MMKVRRRIPRKTAETAELEDRPPTRPASPSRPVPAAGPEALRRQAHARAHAAERALVERDVAAMGARDVAGDGKAEARAALVLVARLVEAHEGLEHLLAQLRRDAGAVVVDV